MTSLLQPHSNKKNPTLWFKPDPPTGDRKNQLGNQKNPTGKFSGMNRGVLQSSPVQQMVSGNPNWWNINNMRPPPQPVPSLLPSSLIPQYSTQPSLPLTAWLENQELPDSWSQLLMGGLMGEEERCSYSNYQVKKMENWEDQMLIQSQSTQVVDVKQESSDGGFFYPQNNEEFRRSRSPWARVMAVSSPSSCITSYSSNILDFSSSKQEGCHQQPDHSSEVRKEKLGDRITALHQLVSPFGKTDTASVLLEAIGYIRFLQSQIEALSSPYMGSGSGNLRQSVQGERNCIFPEDPGQLLNESCMKRRGASDQDVEDEPKRDLRSRGLCLVPVSCTLQVGSDNGADYWAPTLGGGFR